MFLIIRISFFILSVLFLSCSGQKAKSNPKKYRCNYTDRTLFIDGELDEPQWGQASWSDYFIDIEGDASPVPWHKTRMKMLWGKHYLYVAAELEEPHLWATLTDRDAIIYRDNDFEVFIDPDGDGLNYYELEINAMGTEFDLFLDKPYNKKGTADISWDFKGLKSEVSLAGTLNDASDTDNNWTVEIAIPWEAFSANTGLIPVNGDTWRMNFSRVQWDLDTINLHYKKKVNSETGKPLPEHNWVWSEQGAVNMHIPEKWGFIEFTGKPEDLLSDLPEFWIWMSAYRMKSEKEWDRTFQSLKSIGITGLLIAADTIVLKKVIPIANQYNMQVHAWMWTMNSYDAKPEWLSVNRLGHSLADQKAYVDYYKFMCPALPEVQDFILSKMDALSRIEGLSGIHMDYVRYVDVILPVGLWDKYGLVQDHIMPDFDYGYHPHMRQLYEEEYGIDPFLADDIEHDSTWLQFRLNELNKTVTKLRDFTNYKGLDITAAVFPTPEMSREMVRQDWDKWGLDYYFPMVYHSFYNEDIDWIRNVVYENKATLHADAKVFCGLFLPVLKSGNDLTEAINAAYAGGADGIAFFDFNALNKNQIEQISRIVKMKKP